MCFLLISWSSKNGNYTFQSLNHVDINLKPHFLIKSGYYIVPSPSTALSPGGIHMFTLFNDSAPSWNLILFALLEVVLISWAYGVDKFLDHLEDMIPHFSTNAKVKLIPTLFCLFYSNFNKYINSLRSVRLWNFKDGPKKARFLAKNQYTQRKPMYFKNTGSASLSKIEHNFRK